jgi:hypothetical protein
MGASDQSGQWKVGGVPQEVVVICRETNPEIQEDMHRFLEESGIPRDRTTPRYDTWKGVYFTPPDDELPWEETEYDQIREVLENHPNVIRTDVSPSEGSVG